MKQLAASEVIFISKLLQLEASELSVLKGTLPFASDKDLKEMIKTSITDSETRIKGLRQFINDNNVTVAGGVQ
ncbi:hypothetical protein [Acetivibrio straminisolvens]|uniref:Uncharacterized protein n=1 Tax=Acetivibrio straminisolvens JCM 21531 TaxID=1294263 RepID=W4V958_9FIRM|nr:hypothetical protein [Acetivibrio straminisolvens]GAE89294.1 hypothetical protein JCM21531_2805 [Acetivibrio straminisolvens JCM 21531]